MKKLLSFFAVLGLLFACTEENNPEGNETPGDKTVHVTGISLDRPSVTIKEGETLSLVATVTPDNATNKTIQWSSSSDAVATVDNNGKVTGVKAGSATITATTEDGGKKATCALTIEANLAPSVTIGAESISAISVVLKGKANLGTSAASDLKVGFQYSTSAGILPSNSTTVDADDADANYNYTKALTGLNPGTTYYFRSFVRQNGQDTYGETKEFTTKEFETLLETKDAADVEATSATLNGKLDLTDVKYSSISYGFYWSTSETSQNTNLQGGGIADNAFSSSLTNLSHKTQYWYKAYVKLDSQTFYGEVKTFTTDVVKVESVSLDKSEYTFNTIGNTLTLKATVLPADATDKSLEWTSSNEEVATVDADGKVTAKGYGAATITVTTKDQGKTATCAMTVAVKNPCPAGAIDLGLSVYWATCNLGESGFVSFPEASYDYYAWGETETKSDYFWSTYKFGTNSSGPFSKYNTISSYGPVDNKTVLDAEDDVAHVKLGGNWRIPTHAEWTELRNNCTWTWTSLHAVYGVLVTSNTNGNSIFLPAAGYRSSTYLTYEGSHGYYWSSSLDTDYPIQAWSVHLYSSGVAQIIYERRFFGLSVRPVSE